MTVRFAACVAAMAVSGGFLLGAQVKSFRPVTEAMLRNPAPGDWLNWRRTDNAWGYSPLDQITRQNVAAASAGVVVGDGRHRRAGGDAARLRRHHVSAEPARRHSGARRGNRRSDLGVPARARRGTARTSGCATGGGEQTDIPRLSQRPATGGGDTGRGIQRNIAIFGDKIFGTTNDAHIVALDARTGQAGVGHQGRRFEAGLRVHLRPHRRSRQSDRRDHGVQPLQGRRLLHHRPRCGDRKGAVAHVDQSLVPASPAATRGATCR